MKIYFAWSIRWWRDDVHIYVKIIQFLKQYWVVLTEHIADPTLSSMWENLSEKEIFDRDVSMIKESDLVVAEVTNPSLWVGYELGFAESINKKILCLYRVSWDKKLSAMVAGNCCFDIINYTDVEQLLISMKNILD